jgi:hypothetical protein
LLRLLNGKGRFLSLMGSGLSFSMGADPFGRIAAKAI